MNTFWKSAGLLVLGIALGVTITATPVAAQLTAGPSLKQLKKLFYTKGAANARFATKQQLNVVDSKLGEFYKKTEIDSKINGIDSQISGIGTKLGSIRTVETANGVGNNLGCGSGTLAVGITDGNGSPADGRFTFQVPGTPEAFGQIRSDGSIRESSDNVKSVDHLATGVYCVHIDPAPTDTQLESAVVSMHDN